MQVGQELKTVVVEKCEGAVLVAVASGWEGSQKLASLQGKAEPEAQNKSNLAKELKELWAKLGGGMASEAEALPGGMVKAVVTGILPTFVAVRLGPRVAGRIAITDVVNADAMPLLKSSPLADLKKGQVRCRDPAVRSWTLASHVVILMILLRV